MMDFGLPQVKLKSSITEKDLVKGTEQRLMQENKTLIEQQRSQTVLLTNLQTIQVCCYIYIPSTLLYLHAFFIIVTLLDSFKVKVKVKVKVNVLPS